MEATSDKKYSFGDFDLDANKRLLYKRETPVPLKPKTFDLLLTLVENCGKLLTKNELLDLVWEDQFVEENNLTVHVAALRKALGEAKNENRFIVTVPGKGYSFVAEVCCSNPERPVLSIKENSLIVPHKNDHFNEQDEHRNFLPDSYNESESLIGREREIAEIKDLLLSENSRLLVLTGAGGSGKTTLAKFAANELTADFADGVFFVELHSIRDPHLFIPTIRKTLGIEETVGKSSFECLKDFLAEKRILLVLDNFEQLAPAASVVEELQAALPELKVLITSRIALKIKNEIETVVTPLAVPATDADFSIEGLFGYTAVRLFYRRATAVRPNFVISEENAPAIAEICRKLDGLPLAVELAAARIKLLSPREISARLENSLKLLSGGAKNLPERQRTMHGTIEWSYELLDEQEKLLFRRLAIFSGGFTVDAAETILAEKKFQTSDPENSVSASQIETLDLLASLIDSHLLETKEQTDGSMRLRMLEVIREFAFERLQKSGELEMLREDHARFFLSLAEEAEPHLINEHSLKWLEKLESEINNIRSALNWSLQHNTEIAGRIAGATRYFWSNHNYLNEGRKWFEKALGQGQDIPGAVRFKLLNALGQFARSQGNYTTARKYNEIGLREGRAAQDLRQVAVSAHGLAAAAAHLGDLSTARKFNEEELEIARQLGDEYLVAVALSALGDLAIARGAMTDARPLIEESLTSAEKIGNRYILSINSFNLGIIDYSEESYESAYENFAKSLITAQELENKTLISCSLDGFAALAAICGNNEQAARISGAAEGLRKSIGYEIEPSDELFRNNYTAKIRDALDERSFDDAFKQGRALGFAEAVKLADKQSLKIATTGQTDERSIEIIIENHRFERLIIEEEIVQEEVPPIKSINK